MARPEEITVAIKGQNDASPAVDKATQSIRDFDGAMKNTQRGFRLMRGGAAQLSMQVQDVAVQLQGGTNVMTVFAQQGSQIASLFGAGGAFIGALLAVGAAIGQTFLPRLLDTKTNIQKLREELESLGNVMSIDVSEDTFKLTQRFRALAESSEELAKIQLGLNLVKAHKAATSAINATREATSEFITNQYTANQLLIGSRHEVEAYAEAANHLTLAEAAAEAAFVKNEMVLGRLATNLGINKDEMRLLQDAAIGVRDGVDGAIPAFQQLLSQILQNNVGNEKLSETLVENANAVLESAIANAEASAHVERLNELLKDLQGGLKGTSQETLDLKSSQDRFRESLQKQLETLGMSKQQLMEYQAKELELAQDTSILEKIQAIIDKQAELDEQKGIEKLQTSLMTREEALKASYEKELALLESFGAKSAENAELVADLKIKAEERFLNKMEDLRKRSNDFEKKTLQEKTEFVLDDLGGMFQGVKAQNRKMFAVQKAYNIAQTIVETFAGAQKAATAYAAFPPLAAAMAAAHVAAGMARVAAIKSQSFEGGGFTGMGSRSGGVDGKGGFPAILHPNETVIDHTKGQGQGITIINNIDATGASGDVDLKIRAAMQETSQQTIATVQDLMRRRRFA